ncbi:MAG: DOMON-like domain-containing protein [Steroidobacteraceae bacterium]
MSASAELIPHAVTPAAAVRRIAVRLERVDGSGALRIRWQVEGDIARLRLPAKAQALRADGLWQHSCFEVFLQAAHADSYHEFNFAPSGAWAAYRFTGRRSGRSAPPIPPPRIECARQPESFEMSATLPLAGLPECAQSPLLRAGLAAVIEDERGQLAYWALAHRSTQPDFHDPATFMLNVPAR